MGLHNLVGDGPEVLADLTWEGWCMWHPYNCSISFVPSPTPRLSFSHYKYKFTLKVEAENSSENLELLQQNKPSHSSAAGYFTYDIERQLERPARQRCDVNYVASRRHFRKKRSPCHTHAHARTHAQCLLSESGLITQQSWENRQSSACCTSYCVPTIYIIY